MQPYDDVSGLQSYRLDPKMFSGQYACLDCERLEVLLARNTRYTPRQGLVWLANKTYQPKHNST